MTISIDLKSQRGEFKLAATFSAPSTGITAVVGPSGEGKTSLLRAVAGLDPSAGLIRIGEDIWQNESSALPTYRRPLGMVFQEPSLFSHLSVRENLEFASKRATGAVLGLGIDEVCSLTNTSHLLERGTKNLSGGESQRVAIGRALLSEPKIILMDEPVSALDRILKRSILDLIRTINLQFKIPILYVSHSFEEVALIADHYIHLSRGKVDASGPIADLFINPDLSYSTSSDASFILSGKVVGTIEGYGLTKLKVSDHDFLIPNLDAPIDSIVKVMIYARDLTLSKSAPEDSSALNIFPATIDAIFNDRSPTTVIRLSLGCEKMIARITKFSADHLRLSANDRVWISIKAAQVIY